MTKFTIYVGDSDQDKYLFSVKENGNPMSRATSCGYWEAIGIDKQIMCSNWMPIVGIKKTFVFYKGKNSQTNSRTDWLMHEYHIARVGNTQGANSQVIFTGLFRILSHSCTRSIDTQYCIW